MKVYNGVLIGLLLAFLPGCATIGAPGASDNESIRKGEKIVVMLRVAAKVGGQPVNAAKHFGLKIASVDRSEPSQYIFSPSSPSAEARQEGWEYLLLRPGETYYLSSSFGVNSQTGYTPFPLMPNLGFHVPDNRPLVYIGSLSVSCEGKVNYFGVPYVSSCSRLSIVDETESAKSVAVNSFGLYWQQPSTMLMRPWSTLNATQPPALAIHYSPLGIAVSPTENITTPEWRKRALSRATGLGGSINGITVKNLGLGGGYPAGAAGAGVVMGYLLYLPVGTALGIAGGAHSESKWQPCMGRLAQELQASDPTTQLDGALLAALQKRGITQVVQVPVDKEMTEKARQGGLRGILRADVQRVILAECSERWTFSVDALIRARFFETTTGTVLYDRAFLNSDRNRYPYHSYIPRSQCRKIEEYCGEGGTNILREELNRAINSSVAEIAGDLTLQPE